jgi:exodeoxyribonuclease-1
MFIFYDTEACGLDMKFGQILQIAMAFTDESMNILSSKVMQCRRVPWVLPTPGAMLLTGFTPDDLKNARLSNYEMMQETSDWLKAQHWPVLFSGFNTLGFDEELVADSLHQNLLDTEITTAMTPSGRRNGRFDISEVAKAVVSYMPGALRLGKLNERGYASMSLKNIAQQNGIPLGDDEAHDAMNDVKATIGVAKLLKKLAPQIWDQMLQMATPEGVDRFLSTHKMLTHCYMVYGKARGAVVTPLGAPDGIANKEILFDLSYDPAKYANMTVEELKDVVIEQKRKVEQGEIPPPRPFRIVDKTAQPTLMPTGLSDAVIPHFLTEPVARQRMQKVQADKAFQARLRQAVAAAESQLAQKPYNAAPEVIPAQIADAGLKKRILDWAGDFRNAPDAAARVQVIDQFKDRFAAELAADPSLIRFPKFAVRIVYEMDADALPAEQRQRLNQYIAERFFNPDLKAPYCTLAKARAELAEIEDKRRKGDERWAHVTDTDVRALKLYYTSIEKEFAPYLPVQPNLPVNDNAAEPPRNELNQKNTPKPPAA